MKRRTLVDFPLSPHSATLSLDDTLNGRQTDSRSREIFCRMQTLKGPEQLAGVRRVEAGAVISHEILPVAVFSVRAEFDAGMRLLGRELPGIAQQIGHHDPQQSPLRFSKQ